MSGRGSRSAKFINRVKDVQFKKGPDLISSTDLIQLEQLFKKFKSKPWSAKREHTLGILSQKIRKGKEHLNGVSKYSTLYKF